MEAWAFDDCCCFLVYVTSLGLGCCCHRGGFRFHLAGFRLISCLILVVDFLFADHSHHCFQLIGLFHLIAYFLLVVVVDAAEIQFVLYHLLHFHVIKQMIQIRKYIAFGIVLNLEQKEWMK